MSGLLTINVFETRGFIAVPANVDQLALVMGVASARTGQTPYYQSINAATAGVGYGDAPDALRQIIAQRNSNGPQYPACFFGTATGTAGSYGTIDTSGITGTAVVTCDSSSAPYGTYQAGFRVVTGGTIGTSGITYQTTLDNGTNWSRLTKLGTADFIAIPNSNVKFLLNPSAADETALNSFLNLIKTKFNAHVVLTTGSVHSNSDSADVVSTANATNAATRLALANALRAAYAAHRVKGSGGSPAIHINVGGDTTNIVTAPAATDDESVLVLALELAAQINAHEAGTTWHTIADATNTITIPTISPGTLVANDAAYVATYAPTPSGDDIEDAFDAVATSSTQEAMVFCEWPSSAALAAHVTNGLDACKARGKRITATLRTRLPQVGTIGTISGATNATPIVVTVDSTANLTNGYQYTIAGVLGNTAANGSHVVTVIDGTTFSIGVAGNGGYTSGGAVTESEEDWVYNVGLDYFDFSDSRIHVRATYGLITDATTGNQYFRSDFAQFAADAVRNPILNWPDAPADRQMANFTLVDSAGVLVGHDEGPLGTCTGLSDEDQGNRFGCNQRIPGAAQINAVYNTVPWVMYASDERIRNFMVRRIVNSMETDAVRLAIPTLGTSLTYTPADPDVPGSQAMLTAQSVAAIQAAIYGPLASTFASVISNATDADLNTGLVQVSPYITVTGGNLITESVTLAPLLKGYTRALNLQVTVQE